MNRPSPEQVGARVHHGPGNQKLVATVAAALTIAPTFTALLPHAAAQFTLPGTLSSDTPAEVQAPTNIPPSLENGRRLLQGVEVAIARRDFKTAVQQFQQAGKMASQVPALGPDVLKAAEKLAKAGVDKALLAPPARKPVGAPAGLQVNNAQPIQSAAPADAATRKQEALRLMAVGRAALDRGDTSTAVTLARQAQSLNVPDSAYAVGEPRAWQFLLDAESAARRSGVQQTSGTTEFGALLAANANVNGNASDNPVAQTPFLGMAPGAGDAQVAQVQNVAPVPAVANNYGEQVYREGLDLLRQGNSESARAKFVEAWKHQADMPLEVRRSLKEKLTLVQPTSRLPSTGSADSGQSSAMEKADLEAQRETRRLYREATAEMAKANEMKKDEPLEALDKLKALQRRVAGSNVDDTAKRQISSLIDRAIQDQTSYVEANRAQIDLDLRNESIRLDMETESARRAKIDEEVSLLVDQYNDLMRESRFEEAEVIAKQVAELKPGDTIAINMFHNSRMGTRRQMHDQITAAKEDGFARSMLDLEASAAPMNPAFPLEYGDATEWHELSRRRLPDGQSGRGRSPAEERIYQSLETPIDVKFSNRPLKDVMDQISALANVPIYVDERALQAQRLDSSKPVTLNLPGKLPLKNALNLMLRDYELTYMVDQDVLMITTQDVKRSNVYSTVYRVTDLVTPIPNFTATSDNGLQSAMRAAHQMANPSASVQIMPVSATDLGRGMVQNASFDNPLALGQYSPGVTAANGLQFSEPMGGGSMADFSQLMQLIQTTIEPDTWEALGGPSTMFPYSSNLSLVVSTTSDVHDQIADLLESLRRLQNLQITIEVRFITLSDSFFEQIGVDFDVQFDDNNTVIPDEDSGPTVTIGLSQPGVPSADLDIRLDNNFFGSTAPQFGGFDANAASSIGFAILSDIEAFFFLQAVQGNSRSNIMQAPKVTLFDGQLALINDTSAQPFVTSITPVVGDFAVAQQPIITVLNEGTQLQVQGVVSDDKRHVRLTLVPFFSQIGAVNTFTFEGRRSTSRNLTNQEDTNGDGVVDETDTETESDVIEGTTVQLPTFASTSVSTTVSVPDGGTIMLGGIKRLSEGRTERGLPFFSKIPYVSRLFRNVGIGRESSSLMLMVTPRIIIEEEEELAQTGFSTSR